MEQEYFGGEVWRFECQEVGGALIASGTVLASGIVPELVGGGFGEEVSFGGKDVGIEQFGFDGVMHTFDIGVGIGASGRVEAVFGAEGLLDGEVKALGPVVDGVAVKFRAQVGSDDDLAGIDAVALEVLEEALDGEGRIGFGEFVAVGQELRAAGEFAKGVLEAGQAVVLHLGPVEGNIGEVLHIHWEAGEGGIGGFDGAEVVFTAVAAFRGSGEVVGLNDALGGIVAQRQVKLLDEAASAKAGGLLAQGDQAVLQGVFGFVRAGLGGAALGAQAGVTLVLEAAAPFADGVAEAAEVTRRGFDAFDPGKPDELVTQGKMGIVSANHIVVGLGGGRRSKRFI